MNGHTKRREIYTGYSSITIETVFQVAADNRHLLIDTANIWERLYKQTNSRYTYMYINNIG